MTYLSLIFLLAAFFFSCSGGTEVKKKPGREMSYGNKDKFESAHRNYLLSLGALDSTQKQSLSNFERYHKYAQDCQKNLDRAKEGGLDFALTLDFSFRKDALDPDVARVISAAYLSKKCDESLTKTKTDLLEKQKAVNLENESSRIAEYGEIILEFTDKPSGKPKQEFSCGEPIYTILNFKNY